jgi:hypothetical protein
MDKLDSKIRLFLELSCHKTIQILDIIPLYKNDNWSPEQMYYLPHKQYYYVWINDKSLLDSIRLLEKIPDDLNQLYNINNLRIEFNANNIEDNGQGNDEEKYIILAKVNIEKMSFIHDYKKIDREKLKSYKIPIIYALKGKIKVLLLEEKDGEQKIEMEDEINTTNNDDKDKDENNSMIKKIQRDFKKGIDGHWFLVNDLRRVKLLSLIKYKEISINLFDNETSIQNNSPLNYFQNRFNPNEPKNSIINSNLISNNNNNLNKNSFEQYQQPCQYFTINKETNKLISLYQNKNCKLHNKKNDFYCKNCNEFCCLDCLDENNKNYAHKNHKIILLDELLNKIDEDSKALDERISNLKSIIDNEITSKRNEIIKIKNINAEVVKRIIDLNEKRKIKIKMEEIRRAKILASLGTEVLRIINDYHEKVKYLKILAEKGDMSSYLTNYFLFKKFFETDIKKNLMILENKIYDVYKIFKNNNENFIDNIIKQKEEYDPDD